MEVKLRTARFLVDRLRSASEAADAASAAEVIAEIRLLSKHDPDARPLLVSSGAAPLLTAHLRHHDDSGDSTQENASAALLNLSISTRDTLLSIPGLLDALIAGLRLPAPAPAAANSAATVYSLLCDEANRRAIGAQRPLVAALLALARAPDAPTLTVKDALKALFGMAVYPPNRAGLVEAGVVAELLVMATKDGRRGVVEDATAVIAQVALCYESVEAFRRAFGVRILANMVGVGGASPRTKENALAALLNLMKSGGEVAVGEVLEVDGVEEAVRELAIGSEESTERGKSKAQALLRVMESGLRLQSEAEAELKGETWPAQSTEPSFFDGVGGRLYSGR